MEQPIERWLPVPGYEGLYEVSDLGRVRSLRRKGTYGRVLRPAVSRKGKRMVQLHRPDSAKTAYVHHLVLAAFVGSRPPGQVARHLDDNSADNTLSNLAYGTHGDNAQDKLRNGRDPMARRTHCKNGHPFDEANTKITTYPDGRFKQRRCRACSRALADVARASRRSASFDVPKPA